MTDDLFSQWMQACGFDYHGGKRAASEALGISTKTLQRLLHGHKPKDDRLLALAMSAVAHKFQPWPIYPGLGVRYTEVCPPIVPYRDWVVN